MRSQVIAIRLVALIVLLTSAFDYYAFDRWDPSAPMNSAGPEAISAFAPQTAATTASLHTTDLSDDHCLCCSPWIAPPRPVLPRVSVSSSVPQNARAAVPFSDPILIERPPRA
jgi:hypothetical protein